MRLAGGVVDWQGWARPFLAFLHAQPGADGAHDVAHVQRVVRTAVSLCHHEGGELAVVFPAAWLHDCVVIGKDSPLRSRAAQLAAETAVNFLRTLDYPPTYLEGIAHAIAAHSFSAGIPPQTLEAKIVQDADRLDALGAIGIARTFVVGGRLGRPIYAPPDPFCRQRPPDDTIASLDHFYTKLLRLPDTMQTAAGRQAAQQRVAFMHLFLGQLAAEIEP